MSILRLRVVLNDREHARPDRRFSRHHCAKVVVYHIRNHGSPTGQRATYRRIAIDQAIHLQRAANYVEEFSVLIKAY